MRSDGRFVDLCSNAIAHSHTVVPDSHVRLLENHGLMSMRFRPV